MKTILKWVPLFFLISTTAAMAQPAEAEQSAFWVVEGNVKQPDYTIIRFYSTQLLLLKEERIPGKFMDIRKKKNRKLLDSKLKEFLYPQAMANRKRTRNQS